MWRGQVLSIFNEDGEVAEGVCAANQLKEMPYEGLPPDGETLVPSTVGDQGKDEEGEGWNKYCILPRSGKLMEISILRR
jgi:hypothetical protein